MTRSSFHKQSPSSIETSLTKCLSGKNGAATCADGVAVVARDTTAQSCMERMQEAVRTLLSAIEGEDPNREGLVDTPKRVAKAWLEMTRGYDGKPGSVLGDAFFREPSIQQGCGGLVLVRDIGFACLSETTLLPFFGSCHIAYLPRNGLVLGLSKFARITRECARRVQDQKGLTQQIWSALQRELMPCGLVVISQGKHLRGEEEGPGTRTECCSGGRFVKGDELLLQEVLMLLQLPSMDALDAMHSLPDSGGTEDDICDHIMHHEQNAHANGISMADSASDDEPAVGPSTPDLDVKDMNFSSELGSDESLELSSSPMVETEVPVVQLHGSSRSRQMEAAIQVLLQEIGEDPNRKGLSAAAHSYALFLLSSTSGYSMQLPSPSPWTNSTKDSPCLHNAHHISPRAPQSPLSTSTAHPLHECNHQSCSHQGCRPNSQLTTPWEHTENALSSSWDHSQGFRSLRTPTLQACHPNGTSATGCQNGRPAAHCQNGTSSPHSQNRLSPQYCQNGVSSTHCQIRTSCPCCQNGVHFLPWQPSSLQEQNMLATSCSDSSLHECVLSFCSQCEHHLLPFYGNVLVAWVPGPGSRNVTAADIRHIVRMYTRRLQMQERITQQVADGVEHITQAQGVLVLTSASHMCMVARGVECHSSSTLSIAARGLLLHNAPLRLKVIGSASKNPLLFKHRCS